MRILTSLFFIIFIVFMSSSCSETKSASQPTILGTPPKSAFFDVFYEYEFGADGGDGILNYRLVSAPDWLKLETINGAKPSFRIFGTPVYKGDPAEFQEYIDEEFEVVIEVSDGARVEQQTFTVVQMRNEVVFGQPAIRANEGEKSEDIYTGVFDDRCDIPDFSVRNEGGKSVYPFPMVVVLENPAESRTVLKLAFGSSYNPDKDENDSSNLRVARPDVDYIDVEKTIVLEAGVSACLAMVDIFDDSLIEGDQIFDVTIVEVVEGFVELPGKGNITIVDDEPELVFAGASEYVTEGKSSQSYSYEISEAVDYDISVDLHATLSSTAKAEDFALKPATLTFPKGSTSASFTVDILDDGDNDIPPVKGPGSLDEVVIVEAEVASVFELMPLTISINEWSDDKQVAAAAAGVVSNAVVVDAEGDVVVLNTDNGDAAILMYDRVGGAIPFTTLAADSIIKSAAGNEVAVGLAYRTASDASRDVYVVLNTDSVEEGLAAGGATHLGETDIVVRKYSRYTGSRVYGIEWTKQIASSKDDVVEGIALGSDGRAYIYGTTTGTLESGVTNKGGKDAFIYVLNEDGTFAWSRMVGSAGEDVASGVAPTINAIFLEGHTNGAIGGSVIGGVDAFEAKYSIGGIFDSVRQWGTPYDDVVTSAANSESQRWITGYTEGDLTQQDTSNSRGSNDVFYLNYDLLNNVDGLSMFGDATGEDQSVVVTPAGINAIIGGFTAGVLDGQVTAGGNDAYVVGVNPDTVNSTPEWVSQFGGAGDDSVLDIADHNSNKLMVLWQKSDGGLTTYHVKPMSAATGKDLSQ